MMNIKNINVIYIGPIGKVNKPQKGGFESANRRNIDTLKEHGINIIELPYPTTNAKNTIIKKLSYTKFLNIFIALILNSRNIRSRIIHITPLYKYFIYLELPLILIAKILGYKILFDIRAGSFIKYFEKGSTIYRFFIKKAIQHSNIVTVESCKYVGFINKIISNREVIYFPNTVKITQIYESKTDINTYNLIYFGRINKVKGIFLMIDLIKKLDDNFVLYLAGSIEKNVDENLLTHPRIKYLGILNTNELNEYLKKMDFFIFPTIHSGEGQSNSLIEAMSNGLIPICSDNGFNKEVVGSSGVVLNIDAKADDYLIAINSIVNSNTIGLYRKRAINQVIENHNIDIEIAKLINIYNTL